MYTQRVFGLGTIADQNNNLKSITIYFNKLILIIF